MSVDTKDFLTKQRKRATGAVLGHAERAEWYARLTPREKADLREKVLSAIGTYHDAVLDVISTLDGNGGMHNERALELLAELHEKLVAPERALVPQPARAGDGR